MVQAAQEDMGPSSIDWLWALNDWYPANLKLQKMTKLVRRLLEHGQQRRPSASALLEALHTIAAQD